MKTGEVAARLGVSRTTVRNWIEEYADFLNPHLSKSGKGTVLVYFEDDVRVLATVAHCKEQRFTKEEIEHVLQNEDNWVDIPPLPSKEEEAARSQIQLVPLSQYNAAIEALEDERDRILKELAQAQEEIKQLNKEVGLLTGRLEERQKGGEQIEALQAEIVRLNRKIAQQELLLQLRQQQSNNKQ